MENGEEREDSLEDIDPPPKQEPRILPLVPALELARRISSDDSDTKPSVATSSQTGTQVSSSKNSPNGPAEEAQLPTSVLEDATSAIDDDDDDDRRAGKIKVQYIENSRARGVSFARFHTRIVAYSHIHR